jgi:hypothetical protein
VTGELEVRVIALVCGKAPEGFARWTLRLLTDKYIEFKYNDTIAYDRLVGTPRRGLWGGKFRIAEHLKNPT